MIKINEQLDLEAHAHLTAVKKARSLNQSEALCEIIKEHKELTK